MFEKIAATTIIIIMITMIYVVMMIIMQANLEARCLAVGYPTASFTIKFHRYCIKRVNQTDVVTPIEELERR